MDESPEEKLFKLGQVARRQQVYDQLIKAAQPYEFLVPHVGDADIMEQLERLGLPSSLPTVLRVASLVANGVLVENSAYYLMKLVPLAPFPERDQVRDQIWEQLGRRGQ